MTGPVGPVQFRCLFDGRDRLVVYRHMWHDGAPHQGQCEGCTTTAWHLHDATCLHAHGVSLAILTTGRGNETVNFSSSLLDMTPYGRGEAWEDVPEGWPAGDRPVSAGTRPGSPRRWWPGPRRWC